MRKLNAHAEDSGDTRRESKSGAYSVFGFPLTRTYILLVLLSAAGRNKRPL